jgi:hypothetical protein
MMLSTATALTVAWLVFAVELGVLVWLLTRSRRR